MIQLILSNNNKKVINMELNCKALARQHSFISVPIAEAYTLDADI